MTSSFLKLRLIGDPQPNPWNRKRLLQNWMQPLINIHVVLQKFQAKVRRGFTTGIIMCFREAFPAKPLQIMFCWERPINGQSQCCRKLITMARMIYSKTWFIFMIISAVIVEWEAQGMKWKNLINEVVIWRLWSVDFSVFEK